MRARSDRSSLCDLRINCQYACAGMPSLCPIYNSIPHAMIQPSSSRSSLSHRSCKLMPKSVTASSPNSGSGSSGGGSGGAGSSPSNLVRFLQLLGVLLIATTFYFWRQPANTNPEAFSLPPASLPVKRSNILGKAEVLWKHRLTRGPESFAFEPEPYGKYVYTGTLDGKILRMNAKNPKGRYVTGCKERHKYMDRCEVEPVCLVCASLMLSLVFSPALLHLHRLLIQYPAIYHQHWQP